MGAICHTGMSTLLRKHVMDECGGLQAFAGYLAEDYFMAKFVVSRGWRTTISGLPALQNNGGSDLSKFHDRLRRLFINNVYFYCIFKLLYLYTIH